MKIFLSKIKTIHNTEERSTSRMLPRQSRQKNLSRFHGDAQQSQGKRESTRSSKS